MNPTFESKSEAGARVAEIVRKTRETEIELSLRLEGCGQSRIETGLGFLDHMLQTLSFHARIDLQLSCRGDLRVDDHHSAEDCALALGAAVDRALGDRCGIQRFAHAYAPLDEALARAVIDLSGRPSATIELGLQRESIGNWATENITHFFRSWATAARATLHLDLLRGENDHHRCEAAFKAMALSLRNAVRLDSDPILPSTKGVL